MTPSMSLRRPTAITCSSASVRVEPARYGLVDGLRPAMRWLVAGPLELSDRGLLRSRSLGDRVNTSLTRYV